jgi:hypothetical protein
MISHRQNISMQLLDELRANAKKLSKEDKTKSYVEWLNYLSRPYGVSTFQKLKQKAEELERIANKSVIEEEEKIIWQLRLSEPAPWGTLKPIGPEKYLETIGLPNHDEKHVPWPHCFGGLFNCAISSRKQIDKKIFSFDDFDIHYIGEELRVATDQFVLMALIMLSGKIPCGRLFKFSLQDIEAACGLQLDEIGMPMHFREIERTLWRLTHCEFRYESAFSGSILVFADTQQAPEKYRVRFNPALPNLFTKVPIWFGVQ